MTTSVPPPPVGAPFAGPALPAPPRPIGRDEKPAISGVEIAGLLGAGFLLNIGMRVGLDAVATVAAVLLMGAVLLTGERVTQRSAQWLVVGAMGLAPWLMIRASPQLTSITLAAVFGLLVLGASLSRVGSLFDIRFRSILDHLFSPVYEWVYGLDMVQRFIRANTKDRQGAAVMRGLAVAVPVLLVFGVLLASADEVFASFLLFDNLPSLAGHVLATAALATGALGLLSRAAHRTEPDDIAPSTKGMAPLEITIILGSLAALFAAFVGTQIAVAVGGVDHVLATEGLTQAEHAREGFFQLLWVAALTLGLLGTLRAVRARPDVDADRADTDGSDAHTFLGTDRFRPLAIVVLILTLVITAVSMQRLLFYVGSFDLTPLRFWSLAATGWIGVTIVAYLLSVGGLRARASWFPGFMVISAAAFVFGMNVANPDAIVARYNLESQSNGTVDVQAISRLSDDAVLASLEGLDGLDDDTIITFSRLLCGREDLSAGYGLLGQNRAERHADWLLDKFCPEPRPRADGRVSGD